MRDVGSKLTLRLCEFLPGVYLGTDRWVLRVPTGEQDAIPLGQMAYPTAGTLLLASLTLLLLSAPGLRRWAALGDTHPAICFRRLRAGNLRNHFAVAVFCPQRAAVKKCR